MARKRKAEVGEAGGGDRGAIAAVAARLGSWQPASSVLDRVTALETDFLQVDIATRCGGWPLRRFHLVHGPSNEGKTTFALGLGASFLRRGHFFAYVDAEYSTPEDWLAQLMAEAAANPGFVAMRPGTYEEVVSGVREFAQTICQARADGEIAQDTTGLIVVDSLRKLVPKKLLDKMLTGSAGVDGASGRGAMMKAALNSQWLDELTPLLYRSNLAMVVIAREYENAESDPWEPDFKIGGGRAVFFDSSLVCRVSRSFIKIGSGADAAVIGERHRVRIHKTKVGGKSGKVIDAYFHTSNGGVVPAGFWPERDLLEVAIDAGLVEQRGAWYSLGAERIGQGAANALDWLRANPEQAQALLCECRAVAKPVEVEG